MTNKITDKDYITITENGVTVGGKPATKYRGKEIWYMTCLPGVFKDIQQIVKEEYGAAPIEMHVMSSETGGKYAEPGNPSPKRGENSWVSFVFANGIETRWVFANSYSSASVCAVDCALGCGSNVQNFSGFRSGVFGSVADTIKPKAQQAEKANATAKNLLLHDLVNRQRFVH